MVRPPVYDGDRHFRPCRPISSSTINVPFLSLAYLESFSRLSRSFTYVYTLDSIRVFILLLLFTPYLKQALLPLACRLRTSCGRSSRSCNLECSIRRAAHRSMKRSPSKSSRSVDTPWLFHSIPYVHIPSLKGGECSAACVYVPVDDLSLYLSYTLSRIA